MTERRFLADKTVGRLAKWLRLLGFDCAFLPEATPAQLVHVARDERRTVLTKNSKLLPSLGDVEFLFLNHDHTEKQLKQVIGGLDLVIECEGFLSVCSVCNEALTDVKKEDVRGLVPPFVYATRNTFRQCPNCKRIFWAGTHKTKMIDQLRQALDTGEDNHTF